MNTRFIAMGERGLDIEGFYRWAMGDLVDNRNRGIFAEWLVGQALGAISDGEVRHEWDAYDLSYGKTKVEVKASGLSQTFSPGQVSNPRFDIEKKNWSWVAKTNEYIEHDPPVRFADVFVFCLHEPKEATPENVRDPESWKFWVIPTRKINDELGDQKTVGLATLNRLADPIEWSNIKAEVDRLKPV